MSDSENPTVKQLRSIAVDREKGTRFNAESVAEQVIHTRRRRQRVKLAGWVTVGLVAMSITAAGPGEFFFNGDNTTPVAHTVEDDTRLPVDTDTPVGADKDSFDAVDEDLSIAAMAARLEVLEHRKQRLAALMNDVDELQSRESSSAASRQKHRLLALRLEASERLAAAFDSNAGVIDPQI